jgi:hypothetical protein
MVDEAEPRFVWLPFTRKYKKDYEAMYDSAVRGDLLGPDPPTLVWSHAHNLNNYKYGSYTFVCIPT